MLLEAGAKEPQNAGFIALAAMVLTLAFMIYALWSARRAISGKRIVTRRNSHIGRYAVGVIGAALTVAGGFFLGNAVFLIGVITFLWGVRPLVTRSSRQKN